MDAFTSFELEAQRRREILTNDRRPTRTEPVEAPAEGAHMARIAAPATHGLRTPRLPGRITPAGDCQPAPATR